MFSKLQYAVVWLFCFSRYAIRQFYRQRGLQIASSLAYVSLLSMVPLLTVIFGFLGSLPVFDNMAEAVQAFIYNNFVPAFGDTVQLYLSRFSRQASQLTVTGIALLVVIALMLMATIDNALNIIWHIRKRRNPMVRFLIYWAMLTLGPLLVGFGLVATSYLLSLPVVNEVDAFFGFKKELLSWLPLFSTAIAFTLLYVLIPNCFVSRKHAMVGGAFSAVLFECAKYEFGIYVKSVTVYKTIYGAIAVIPMFLIWIYLSWVIVLLGAHITFCLSAFRLEAERSDMKDPAWTFIDVYRIIAVLWSAQKQGRAVLVSSLRQAGIKIPQYQLSEIMEILHRANWVSRKSGGSWLLCRDLTDVTLMDLYRLFPNRLPVQATDSAVDEQTSQLSALLAQHQRMLSEVLTVPIATILQGD